MGGLIVTVTPNPAYDVSYATDGLDPGRVHRVATARRRAGGKGVNVAAVLARLGEPVVASGLAGPGFAADVERLGVRSAFVESLPSVRSTVTVFDGERTTSFWEPGSAPVDTPAAERDLCDRVEGLLPGAGCVVVSGSLPPGVDPSLPATLARRAHDRGVRSVLDVSGAALRAAAEVPGVVLAPNAEELADLCGPSGTTSEVVAAARTLVGRGVGAVFATRGAEGIVVAAPDGCWVVPGVRGVAGNPTGAGDAATAAIARGVTAGDAPARIAQDAVALAATAVTAPVAGVVDVPRFQHHRVRTTAHALDEDAP
ncbi:1-phosphofructokinase family hexose kinase [Nocardioides sp. GXQ0305]|uniref:1-phosphofructokinase family hexose kinase n=1 Tax=Nocardioides sp. GXQ0305 TaxID=3423912 RepID=UPI003D7CBCAB